MTNHAFTSCVAGLAAAAVMAAAGTHVAHVLSVAASLLGVAS